MNIYNCFTKDNVFLTKGRYKSSCNYLMSGIKCIIRYSCKESNKCICIYCKIICSILSEHIGEGNGNALQCSCLENPRDGGA